MSSKTDRVKGRLELSNSKLKTILDITNAINNNSSQEELFKILKRILVEDLQINRFALFISNKSWETALYSGFSARDVDQVKIDSLAEKFRDIDVLNDKQDKHLSEFDIVIPVFHKDTPLAYLLLADFEEEKLEISPIVKHLRFIQTLANIVVVALENKRLNKEHIKQVELQKELELAQSMQSLLFPRILPSSKDLSVLTYYLPHSEVGGDYYDVIKLKGKKTALCIADVSGKGMPAAILMANFQANLRALLNVTESLEELVKLCNQKIIESANYEKFITLFVCIFDPSNKTLSYLNAGHQPGILIQNGNYQLLKKGCTVLGMFDDLPAIQSETIKLSQNSKLLCFTDGLTELEDNNQKQIEVDGIIKLIELNSSLENMHNAIENRVEGLQKQSGLQDDITFLTASFLD